VKFNLDLPMIGKGSFAMDRRLMMPSALGNAVTMAAPSIQGNPYTPGGSIRVKHREFLSDLAGFTAFGLRSWVINPGLGSLFSWLSQIAGSFEEYKFHRLCLVYQTFAGTDTKGSVMVAYDYDIADDNPSSKQDLLAFYGAQRCPAWAELCCPLEAKKTANKFLLVRTGAETGYDMHLYDVARLIVAVQGFEDDYESVGELYLDYDVELRVPQKRSDSDESDDGTGYFGSLSATYLLLASANNGGDLECDTIGNNIFQIKEAGEYLVKVHAYGVGINASSIGMTASYQFSSGVPSVSGFVEWVSSTTDIMTEFAVRAPDPGVLLTLTRGGTLGTLTGCNITILRGNYNLLVEE
jgi:hypothetical protein